tara:strand:- start:187 stop:375 length:189 start_codon:yes stop_codon:yes gene_type:complete
MNDEWPYLSPGLINKLNEVCPERCPSPDETPSEIHHYAGRRAMVNFLTSIHLEQHNKEDKDA